MRTRKIGPVSVSAIGFGAMPLSIEDRPDEDQAVRVIHAALDAGVTLIDTADAYCQRAGETGHNERLIAKALASYPGDAGDVLALGLRLPESHPEGVGSALQIALEVDPGMCLLVCPIYEGV